MEEDVKKGFDLRDGKYMCKCMCGKVFFSNNKRDLTCPECGKSIEVKYLIQKLIYTTNNKYVWIDSGISTNNVKGIFEFKKIERATDINTILRVVKETREVITEDNN